MPRENGIERGRNVCYNGGEHVSPNVPMERFNSCHYDGFREDRLLFFEGKETPQRSEEKKDGEWLRLRRKMQTLDDDYRLYDKHYKKSFDRGERPSVGKLNEIRFRQERLQVSVDLANPELQAIVLSLEPKNPTSSRLDSLKKSIGFGKKKETKNTSTNLRFGDRIANIYYQWSDSEQRKTVEETLRGLDDNVKRELRSWAEPQLAPQQIRQWEFDRSEGSTTPDEMHLLSGVVDRCFSNLSMDALEEIPEVPGGATKVYLRVLEGFADYLKRNEKDAAAEQVTAIVQKLRS